MKLEGKPVVFVCDFSHHTLDRFGSPERMKKAKEYGHEGIVFAIECCSDAEELALWKQCGYNISFAYCWQTYALSLSQNEAIDFQMNKMRAHLEFDPCGKILTCSQMWDPYPIHRHSGKKCEEITRWRLTPDNWERLLEQTKDLALRLPEAAIGRRMIMLDNWNEWCEGHYIAPHAEDGFKYLDAVRRVFTKCDNTPDHRDPKELGFGPYGKNIDLSIKHDFVKYILNKMS